MWPTYVLKVGYFSPLIEFTRILGFLLGLIKTLQIPMSPVLVSFKQKYYFISERRLYLHREYVPGGHKMVNTGFWKKSDIFTIKPPLFKFPDA